MDMGVMAFIMKRAIPDEIINRDSHAEATEKQKEGIENYVGYLAKRPGAERGEQDHALWNGSSGVFSIRKPGAGSATLKRIPL